MSARDDDKLRNRDKVLLQPLHYISRIPGKQIRTKLIKAFNTWLNVEEEKLHIIAEVVQMLHNASLLIDDIEDNSKLRRGIPVAHNIYGIATTINAANYAYFLGLQKIMELENPEATKIFSEQLLELHRGQGMEIYWRDNFICPTEEEYKEMVIKKTGGLFGLAVRLMQLFSKNNSDFTCLTGLLGLYFQIRDDYSNLISTNYTDNKGYCEDLTEGKFSFPIIHAIRSHPEDNRVINILRRRTADTEIKKYCVSILESYGSLSYTCKTLEKLDKQAGIETDRLGENPFLRSLLDELRTWNSEYGISFSS